MKLIIGLLIAAAIAAGAFFYFKKKAAASAAGASDATSTDTAPALQTLQTPITINGKTAFYKSVSDAGVEYYGADQVKLNLSTGEKMAFSTKEKQNKISQ